MENTVKRDLTGDKDLIAFLQSYKMAASSVMLYCTSDQGKKVEWNYSHGVSITYKSIFFILLLGSHVKSPNSQTPNVYV